MSREYKRSAPQTAQRAQDQARQKGEASPSITASHTFASNRFMHDVRDLAGTGLDEPTPMKLRARNGQSIEMCRVGDVTEATAPAIMPDAAAGHTPETWEASQMSAEELAHENQITMARREILEIGARPRRVAHNLAAMRRKFEIEKATGALPNSVEERAADKSALLALFMDSLKQSHYERDADRVKHFESVAAEAEGHLAERHAYNPRVKLAHFIAAF